MTYIKDYTTVYVFGDRKYEVTAPARFDEKTNKPIYDPELDDFALQQAMAAYRKDMGLFDPEELKAWRLSRDLSYIDMASVTGLSVNTLKLYEAGAFPSPADNIAIKKLLQKK